MKNNFKLILKKALVPLITFFATFLLFQLTYASNVSFSNPRIDEFVHHSQFIIGAIAIILFMLLIITHIKIKWIKITLGILMVPIFLIMLLGLLFISYGVLADSNSYARFYYYENDGFKYFVTSERYVAFSGGRELKYYKEKDLIFFLKARKELTDVEVSSLQPFTQAAAESLWEKYQR